MKGFFKNIYLTEKNYPLFQKYFIRKVKELEEFLEKAYEKYGYITLNEEKIFIPAIKAVINNLLKTTPDTASLYYDFPKEKITGIICQKRAELPYYNEALNIYNTFQDWFRQRSDDYISFKKTDNTVSSATNAAETIGFNGSKKRTAYIIYLIRYSSHLQAMLENNFRYTNMSDEQKKTYNNLEKLFEHNIVELRNGELVFLESTYDKFASLISSGTLDFETDEVLIDPNDLLTRDKVRCGLTEYDSKILTDSNRGHWEIWDPEVTEGTVEAINVDGELMYARNPACDINSSSLVAIDFGTKSTVAVILDEENRFRPIRIGSGNFNKSGGFENPTVMQFIDFDEFMHCYKSQDGRPLTSFNDICVSYHANDALTASGNSDYKCFVNRIKQYAGGDYPLRKTDKKKKDIKILPYNSLGEGDLDVVELYAYYIGLYINNMYRKIFLRYTLSMPVNFETNVRNRIKKSFENGLKKSLPTALLHNSEAMKGFNVNASCNESAAFAVTALKEFGFDPEEGENVFYGVFDFGGGTTDFDFGFWRCANSNERRYDNVITYYDDEGDKTLGGENILDIIAYTVWCDNIEQMRKSGIPINIPDDCEILPDCELLICSDNRSGVRSPSDESSFNNWKLCEELRWIWEESNPPEEYVQCSEKETFDAIDDLNVDDIDGNEDDVHPEDNNINEIIPEINYHSYKKKLTLYKTDGTADNQLELTIDTEKIRNVIRKRIERGVANFFECLRKNTRRYISEEKDNDVRINIFLAGNSCKSSIVINLFNEYIEKEFEKLSVNGGVQDYFRLFSPLGTEAATLQRQQRGVTDKDQQIRPNCKTGVAYGLLLSREGGRIKIIDKRTNSSVFDYYIGYERKGRFIHITDKNISFEKWYEHIDASEKTFELYYTTYPDAITDTVPITETKKMICSIDTVDENAFVYYRPIYHNEIEYVVATSCNNGIISEDNMLTSPVRILLP